MGKINFDLILLNEFKWDSRQTPHDVCIQKGFFNNESDKKYFFYLYKVL